MLSYEKLKQRHRDERDNYSPALSLRVHRALSWLNKAEMCEDDDSKFTFLWIAFNSAYAKEFEQATYYGERGIHQEFLSQVVAYDLENLLYKAVWENYSGSVRFILNSEYILQSYWDFHSDRISESQWKEEKTKAIKAAHASLAHNDTASVLSILFSRLYTLRNQIIHGGATYNSSANRKQLRDCTQILEIIVPTIISIMMDAGDLQWGEPVYPLVGA